MLIKEAWTNSNTGANLCASPIDTTHEFGNWKKEAVNSSNTEIKTHELGNSTKGVDDSSKMSI